MFQAVRYFTLHERVGLTHDSTPAALQFELKFVIVIWSPESAMNSLWPRC